MVFFTLAGAAAASGAASAFSYNRAGWMNDVQVNQTRRYQVQQVRLSQAGMFREDIRDLVQASVTKLGNFVIIETLVFGMITECYLNGPLPAEAPEFVNSVYMLCIGSSMLYMVMSVLCAVWAQHLSNMCQKELLTTLVRLPVEEFEAEIEAAAAHESAEAFEHQSLGTMLRLPGLSRLAQDGPRPPEARQPKQPVLSFSAIGGGAATVPQVEHSEQHLAVFQQKEKEWSVLGNCAFMYGALGVSQMLQGYGYFATAKYYSGSTYASAAVQFVMVAVDAILGQAYMQYSLPMALLCMAAVVAGPGAALIAIRTTKTDNDSLYVLACFACHLLRNCLGCLPLTRLAVWPEYDPTIGGPAPATTGCPTGPQNSHPAAQEVAQLHRAAAAGAFAPAAVETPGHQRWRRRLAKPSSEPVKGKGITGASSSKTHRWRRWLVLAGAGIVLTAWFATLCWSAYVVAIYGAVNAENMGVLLPEEQDMVISTDGPDFEGTVSTDTGHASLRGSA